MGASLQLLIHSYFFTKTTRVVVTRKKRSAVVIGYIILYNHLGKSWNVGIHRMCNLNFIPFNYKLYGHNDLHSYKCIFPTIFNSICNSHYTYW